MCESRRRTIWLCRGLGGATVPSLRQVLLHEMCHHGSPTHGRAWLAKMRRLAERGEAWAGEQAEAYAGGAPPAVGDSFAEDVAQRLEELSWHADGSGWPAALAILSAEFGVSPFQLVAFAPGARATWKALRAEQRARDEQPAHFFPEPFDRGGALTVPGQ